MHRTSASKYPSLSRGSINSLIATSSSNGRACKIVKKKSQFISTDFRPEWKVNMLWNGISNSVGIHEQNMPKVFQNSYPFSKILLTFWSVYIDSFSSGNELNQHHPERIHIGLFGNFTTLSVFRSQVPWKTKKHVNKCLDR